MDYQLADLVVKIVAAAGTITVAVLAVWGDKIRARFAGPNIELALRDARGNLTTRGDGGKVAYYHIVVTNRRRWSPAKNVRLLLTGIQTRAADGRYAPERVVHAVQLTWQFPRFHELSPTITAVDMCDFGSLGERESAFVPSLYITPNDFPGLVRPGESKRFLIVASADNFYSKVPLVLEVSWDGKWTADTEELMKHLVVSEVA